jgi:DNA-binding beta-propeller fold protein YncE
MRTTTFRTAAFARLPLILLMAILACLRLGAQQLPPLPPLPNTDNASDWMREMNHLLNEEDRNGGFVPGRTYQGFFEVCIDNHINYLHFLAFGSEDGGLYFQYEPPPDATDMECTTSTDLMNLDNSNQNEMKDVLNSLRGQGAQFSVPRTARAAEVTATDVTLPDLLPPLADVPFLPFYAPSLYPVSPSCDPSTAPDVLMVNHSSATVTRYTSCRGPTVAVIPVGSHPLQVDLTPDGSLAVVTSFDGYINFIDTSTNQATIMLTSSDYNPSGVAVSPDGAFAYVTSYNNAVPALLKVDLTSMQVTAALPFSVAYPQSVSLTPDGSQAYVLFPFSPILYIVDTLTMSVVLQVSLPGSAYGAVFNSTGTQAYLGVRSTPGTIQVLNTGNYTITASIPVGDNPTDLYVLYDSVLLTGNYYGNSMSVIDLASLTVLQTLSLPGPPHGLVQTQ